MHAFWSRLTVTLLLSAACAAHGLEPIRIATAHSYIVVNGISLLRQAYGRLGMEIEEVDIPSERGLRMSNEGLLDGEVARVEGLEQTYPNLIRVPVAVLATSVEAIAIDPSIRVSKWEDLRRYSLCIPHGIKAIELPTAGMNAYTVNSGQQIIKMLKVKHCQVGVIASATWADYEDLDWSGIRPVGRLGSFPLYHYLHKRHADLVPRLSAVLKQMRAEGVIAKIQKTTDDEAVAARSRVLGQTPSAPAR
jgi:polar amino acid transport system substrate-binding protein